MTNEQAELLLSEFVRLNDILLAMALRDRNRDKKGSGLADFPAQTLPVPR
jgi:hypothetical protein